MNGDGISDIWAMKYQAGGLVMTADSDGDGQSNGAEAAAGTDPMKTDSAIKVTGMSVDIYGFHLTFPTQAGKRYQVQSKATLADATWTDVVGAALMGNGSETTATVSATSGQYFRVLVQDVDTDGDGVTDWEEIAVGFDPNNAHSGGLNGPDDLTAIGSALTATNVVTVTATDAGATEPASAGQTVDTGTFTIVRSGGLNAITVNYAMSGGAGGGVDYEAVTGSVTLGLGVKSATVTITPKLDAAAESTEAAILTISPAAAYSVGSPAVAAVLIGDNVTPTGTGLSAQFYNEASTGGAALSTSVPPVFTNLKTSRTDATVNYDYTVTPWPNAVSGSPVNKTYFASRWTGEVLPEFSQIYTFYTDVNAAGRVWVNGQLLTNNWPRTGYTTSSAEYSGTIELQAGVRVPIVFEHYEITGDNAKAKLSWSSGNQAKQLIPTARLFPNAAPQILSALDVLLIKGSGPYTYQIVASGTPTSYSAVNLPPGWTINPTNGLISGSPTQAGIWQVPISAVNAFGSGAAVLKIEVIATGGGITRDVWDNVPGTLVSDVPLTTTPTSTSAITSLEVAQSSPDADNFGERIRGYITAPQSGTYQFWLAADHAAELWISNDEEVINLFQRASLTAPVGFRAWADAAKTPLLYLKAGSRYYVEVRHKEAAGTDHVSVGWSKPSDSFTTPAEVVPGYALSPWVTPTGQTGNGTLFLANLVPQNGALTNASGTSSILLSGDETFAIITVNYSNLSSPFTGMHVHDSMIPNPPGGLANVVCDLDQPGDAIHQQDGTYLWTIQPRSGRSVAQIVADLKAAQPQLYFNVHSVNYPGGEIKDYYRLLVGSQTFTAPPAPPDWTTNPGDASSNVNAAARFLQQATFGASPADITAVTTSGYSGWIDAQFAKPVTRHLPIVVANKNVTVPANPTYATALTTNAWWQNSITADDQLRQRVAFALSEIVVNSTAGPLEDRADALSDYYDALLDGAFGNFRQILEDVTLHPAMGRYLDMLGNDKPNKATGLHPNENYAREIMQLFSIGLNRTHPDGSLMINSKGQPIPTYDQDAIIGLAHVFTGWTYNQFDPAAPPAIRPTAFPSASNWILPMTEVPSHHFTGQKRVLNNVVLPGLPTLPSLSGNPVLDPYATHTSTQINTPEYQALPAQEIDGSHDSLFNHPNCGPFICRQLIQRLVTSTPSRGYVYRVVSAFNDNGGGHVLPADDHLRGDMKAVIKAILLDYEARSTTARSAQGFGKQREPLVRATQLARAFPAPTAVAGTYTQAGPIITVNATAHRLTSGQATRLNFTNPGGGLPSATSGDYTVSGSYPVSANQFTVRAKDILGATYTQAAGSNILSVTTVNIVPTGTPAVVSHGLVDNDSVFLKFTSGSPLPGDGVFVVNTNSTTQFDITMPDAVARTGNATMAWLKGGYTIGGSGSTTVTFTCTTNHGLATGNNVTISFTGSNGTTAPAANGVFPITVLDTTRFTVTLGTAPGSKNGTFTAGAVELGANFNRSGDVAAGFSKWDLGTTDTTLGETPLRSPTVFNFYTPDYQFPGELTANGMVTPEFQLTSETNVVRQSNFMFGGIFSSSSDPAAGPSTGFSSFSNGGGSIAFDIGAWLQNGPGGVPWASDANLSALIDEMNKLLMAGQMTSAMKTLVQNYAQGLSAKAITGISASGATTTLTVNGHGLVAGQSVTISGVTGGTFTPTINGTFTISSATTNTFTVPVTRNSSTGQSFTNALAASASYPNLYRDRVRAIIHLIVISPEYGIQK